MKEIEAFPLTWPDGWKRSTYRERSRFKVTPGYARDSLFSELRRLGAKKIILSSNVALRNDGLPYSNRRSPDDPGVAVYFDYKNKPMVFACDQWHSVEENTWAIAKTIDAIRGIERWSASEMLEKAFTGFQALPAPANKEPWWETLGVPKDAPWERVSRRFRELAIQHHPDKGGDPDRMVIYNLAFAQAKEERRAQ